MDFTIDNYFFVRVSDICSVFDNTREDKNGEHADTTPKSKEPKVREQGVNPVRKIGASLLPCITDGRMKARVTTHYASHNDSHFSFQ